MKIHLIFSMSPGVMAFVRSIKRAGTKKRSWILATIFLHLFLKQQSLLKFHTHVINNLVVIFGFDLIL